MAAAGFPLAPIPPRYPYAAGTFAGHGRRRSQLHRDSVRRVYTQPVARGEPQAIKDCQRCVAHIDRGHGRRCRRRTCRTPYCAAHLEQIEGVQLKPAYRNGHPIGLGVFAARDIPACTPIGRYRGNLLTRDQLDAIYPDGVNAEYALKVGAEHYIDAPQTTRSIGRFFNTCDHPRGAPSRGCVNNAGFVVNPAAKTAYVRACSRIRRGDEINVGYVNPGEGDDVYAIGDAALVPGRTTCANVRVRCADVRAPPLQQPRGPQ